jgi:hypothetical protein
MACDEAVTKIPRPSGLSPRQMFDGHAMRAALERTTDEKKKIENKKKSHGTTAIDVSLSRIH